MTPRDEYIDVLTRCRVGNKALILDLLSARRAVLIEQLVDASQDTFKGIQGAIRELQDITDALNADDIPERKHPY